MENKLEKIEEEIANTPAGYISPEQEKACLVCTCLVMNCCVSAEFKRLAKGIVNVPDDVKIYDDVLRFALENPEKFLEPALSKKKAKK